MGNLCCCAARIAPTNIFTAGEIDGISHQLELFFERVVPRTPRGTLDVDRCERKAVRDAVAHANANVAKRYDEAFHAYELRNGKALPVAEKFRETCATLTTEFSPIQPPRCALPPGSDVELLIKLASEHEGAADRREGKVGLWRGRGPRRRRGARDGRFRFAGRAQLDALAAARPHKRVLSVAVFPDGRRVVSGSWDETLKVWDVATGKCVATLQGHSGGRRDSGGVSGVAVFPDGRRIVSGSLDKSLKVWSVLPGQKVRLKKSHREHIDILIPPGDLSKLVELRTLEGHSSSVRCVAVFPDGRRVVSCGDHDGFYETGVVKVWDVATGECLATLEVDYWVKSVAVLPDGRRVVCAGANTLKVWDVATGKCVVTMEGRFYHEPVWGVAVFPDGRRVVSCQGENGEPGLVNVWDVATGKCVATLKGHSDRVHSVAVFPDGRRVVSGSRDGTLKVWDVKKRKCVATLKAGQTQVWGVAVFPDGRRVVSVAWDNTLKVWDVVTRKCVATLIGHSDGVHCVAVFPNGQRVVSASYDRTLKVWDVATGKCVATLTGHLEWATGIAVLPDGRRVVSAGDKPLRVWELPKS